jgi:hypothetical protein
LPGFPSFGRRGGNPAQNARLRPAATEIDEALAALATLRTRPIGHLRLSVPRIALALVIEPAITGNYWCRRPMMAADLASLTAHF